MKRVRVFLIVACLVTVGCSEDPARSVKIINRPPASASTIAASSPAPVKTIDRPPPPAAAVAASSPAPAKIIDRPPLPAIATAATSPASDPIPEFCPPPAEDSPGPGNLIVNGPCGFEHRGAVICEASRDDFTVAFTRKAKGGAALVTFLNVEHYHGPGNYDGAQMFVAVQSDATIYRWSSDNVNATVAPGEGFVTLPVTQLDGEPVLVECSRLIGPASNYQYQCGGRSDAKVAIDSTAEVVSGNLQCGEHQKE